MISPLITVKIQSRRSLAERKKKRRGFFSRH